MTTCILADITVSITEFKADPMRVVSNSHGEPVAVLNKDEPIFYCVPAEAYKLLMDRLEDIKLQAIVKERQDQPSIMVDINDL